MDNMARIVTALRAFEDGDNPDPATTKLLRDGGYINVSETTNIQSKEREYQAISITARGRELLEDSKK